MINLDRLAHSVKLGFHDDLPEQAFYMVGTIEEAREMGKNLLA